MGRGDAFGSFADPIGFFFSSEERRDDGEQATDSSHSGGKEAGPSQRNRLPVVTARLAAYAAIIIITITIISVIVT